MSWPIALVICVAILAVLNSADRAIAVWKVPYLKIRLADAELVGRGERAVGHLIERSELGNGAITPNDIRRARRAADSGPRSSTS